MERRVLGCVYLLVTIIHSGLLPEQEQELGITINYLNMLKDLGTYLFP